METNTTNTAKQKKSQVEDTNLGPTEGQEKRMGKTGIESRLMVQSLDEIM
jgi:hypothetical protein